VIKLAAFAHGANPHVVIRRAQGWQGGGSRATRCSTQQRTQWSSD